MIYYNEITVQISSNSNFIYLWKIEFTMLIVNIFVHLNTAQIERGEYITNRLTIFKLYLFSNHILNDFFSLLAFYMFYYEVFQTDLN